MHSKKRGNYTNNNNMLPGIIYEQKTKLVPRSPTMQTLML